MKPQNTINTQHIMELADMYAHAKVTDDCPPEKLPRNLLQAAVEELETQLAAVGAGGVSPLIAVAAGWQPIETAPQDGDVLLCSSITKRKPIIDRWRDYCRVNQPQFTHWQPLPTAPSIAGESNG